MPGWQSLIVCDGIETTIKTATKTTTLPECDFNSLITLVKALITDMVLISTLLAVITFIFAAIKLLSSGGNESAMKDAKKMFGNVVIGYLWILGAWLVVYTITSILLNPGYSFLGAPR